MLLFFCLTFLKCILYHFYNGEEKEKKKNYNLYSLETVGWKCNHLNLFKETYLKTDS